MSIQNHQLHKGQTSDQLPRTDWFGPDTDPTIPGPYECSTTGDEKGHIFQRRWDGTHWISSVTFAPTTVRMHWRGVKPGSVEIGLYNSAIRVLLRESKPAIGAPFDASSAVLVRYNPLNPSHP